MEHSIGEYGTKDALVVVMDGLGGGADPINTPIKVHANFVADGTQSVLSFSPPIRSTLCVPQRGGI